MKYANVLKDLYSRFPKFREKKWEGYSEFDFTLPYPTFSCFERYLFDLIEAKTPENLQEIKKIIDFLEEMALSDDKEVKYLLADFFTGNAFSKEEDKKILLNYLKPESKKMCLKILGEK